MKINWRIRMKNPYFWVGLIAVILAAVGVSPDQLTSWALLHQKATELIHNPFALGCMAVAILGYINDPTTAGLSDSSQALHYTCPKKKC